ncbi:MAG TPA: hypothetical protein VFV81_08135 [Verrucomicrobiae bacterium]|nr:hypothetical protein [Verrucomicrobiae bacterium]
MNGNDEFESLRQLLALKRHEVPPPGYFNRFSDNVLARIQAAEQEAALPWFVRLLHLLELKPAFAGGFASAVCLLLLFGIVYAGSDNTTPQSLFSQSQPTASLSGQFASASAGTTPAAVNQVFASNPTNFDASMRPMGQTFGSPNPMFQQVNFNLGQ